MRSGADDILGPTAVADPYSYFAELRATDPVHWIASYRSWFVVRHDDVSEALKNEDFSSDRIAPVIERLRSKDRPDISLIETLELLNGWLVFRNPPEHTRFRRLVHKAFSPRMIAAMREEVVSVAGELMDLAVARSSPDRPTDLIHEIAYPLPAIVIAGMLGVPPEDRDLFKDWSDDISALVFGALDDEGRHERARHGMSELVRYIGELLDRVRLQPGDDLATALVESRDGEDGLTNEELIAICVNLLFGGHETTTNLIANSMLGLLKNPEQKELLRTDPAIIGAAIEEFLRYDGPAKSVVRVVAADTELGGKSMKRGDRVFLMLAGANHDPEVFDRPDELDLRRKPNKHIGFGAGVHYCLGASLARLEASVVIPLMLERFPECELGSEQLEWDPVLLTRGMKHLPVFLHADR
ncbi:cytochrome P450 [Gordonia rubripertincta]|uniref:Cytochrome P450 n=1 Tax=Gordonia rubripertincta TaxID=36822 RepID=A0ABT4MZM6_GORRU|nr:cytochrome P450 [Gordonia rubripertincta]MCZ4552447.1 cytochrome P450 [Gordonia rubripertincta]